MFLFFSCIFLIFSCCNGNNKTTSVCDTINHYEKTILPTSIATVAKDDYLGALYTVWHQIYVVSSKYWPNTTDYCKTGQVAIGKIIIIFSLRSRGCCSTCCLIDNTESHLGLYYVFKNKTATRVDLNLKKKGTLAALGINKKAITIFHCHGFSEIGSSGRSGRIIAQAYMDRNETYNMFKLDYSELAAIPWYIEAIDNCKIIAKAIAKFVIFYHKSGELPIENIHLMGISLGGQLASHIAKEIGKYKKVKRLTGLDPAYPLYPRKDDSERISTSDAEFVDVIHTDPGGNGFPTSLGHADFYISYPVGPRPGCDFWDLYERGEFGDFFICDHIRSLRLYIDSVDYPYSFPVSKETANGTISGYMGLLANKTNTIGDFYMTVYTKLPFGRPFEE